MEPRRAPSQSSWRVKYHDLYAAWPSQKELDTKYPEYASVLLFIWLTGRLKGFVDKYLKEVSKPNCESRRRSGLTAASRTFTDSQMVEVRLIVEKWRQLLPKEFQGDKRLREYLEERLKVRNRAHPTFKYTTLPVAILVCAISENHRSRLLL